MDLRVRRAGWNTYAGLVTNVPDAGLDLAEVKFLLKRIGMGGKQSKAIRY